MRRSIEEQPEHAYYGFYAPTPKTMLKTLVRVAGRRWAIESAGTVCGTLSALV